MASVGSAKEGDVIDLDFDAKGVSVSDNGRRADASTIPPSPGALLRMAGRNPSQSSLKKALLGNQAESPTIWNESGKELPPACPRTSSSTASTMVTVVRDSCRQYAGKTSYISMGKSISYAELDALTRDFAAWLHANGLGKGDRIALMMPNLLQYPVCLFGAWRAGCVVVNCNPLSHRARAGAPAGRLGRARHRGGGQLRGHVAAGACPRAPSSACWSLHRRIAGPAQGRLVDLVVKRVKRMVPAWSIPGAQRWAALRAGRAPPFTEVELNQDDLACLHTRAAPPAWPRRPCCPTAT